MTAPRALIVGAGLMGLSAAWALARSGWRVRVFDRAAPPNPMGASVDEGRLIRFPYGDRRGYTALVRPAFAAWETLWADLGETLYTRTGVLALLGDAPGDWARASAASLRALAIPHDILTPAEIRARWPALILENGAGALFQSDAGVLRAGAILRALARRVVALGGAIDAPRPIRAVDPHAGTVIDEAGATLTGEAVIVAAGPWTARLLPGLAAHAHPSGQVSLLFDLDRAEAERLGRMPMLLDLDPESGFYWVPPTPGARMKIGDHRFSGRGDPDGPRAVTDGETAALRAPLARRFHGADGWRVGEAKRCFYTLAPDERFHVVPIGARGWGLTGFSGHGFKFGPLIGLELAKVLAKGADPRALSALAAGDGPGYTAPDPSEEKEAAP